MVPTCAAMVAAMVAVTVVVRDACGGAVHLENHYNAKGENANRTTASFFIGGSWAHV